VSTTQSTTTPASRSFRCSHKVRCLETHDIPSIMILSVLSQDAEIIGLASGCSPCDSRLGPAALSIKTLSVLPQGAETAAALR